MRHYLFLISLLAALGATALPADAAPYWMTYEGDDLPENEGWFRNWGNDDGVFQGDGAIRTLEDGVLTMDTLYSDRVYDFAIKGMGGNMDPDPGELFVVEARLMVEQSIGDHYDVSFGACSDQGMLLAISIFPDRIESIFEDDVVIPIEPSVFHEYRVESSDMHVYDLYVDGELARQGEFWEGVIRSNFGWGDDVRGAASLSHWDYVRFGVVPEPSGLILFIILSVRGVRGRRKEIKKLKKLGTVTN